MAVHHSRPRPEDTGYDAAAEYEVAGGPATGEDRARLDPVVKVA